MLAGCNITQDPLAMEESVEKKQKSPQPVNEMPCSKENDETPIISEDKLLKESSTSPTESELVKDAGNNVLRYFIFRTS